MAGLRNGRLLSRAEAVGFEVFLTVDSGVEYQQNLEGRRIAITIVHARSNRLADLQPHAAACLAALVTIRTGQLLTVGN